MINYYGLKRYCCEDISLIENYDIAINSDIEYDCHHRLEILGDSVYTVKQLKDLGLYYNRPASELILLTKSDHSKLHSLNKSMEVRLKLSNRLRDKNDPIHLVEHSGPHNSMYGKHVSEYTKHLLSLNMKQYISTLSDELRRSKFSVKNNAMSVKCMYVPTGEIFDSISLASKHSNINYRTFKWRLLHNRLSDYIIIEK